MALMQPGHPHLFVAAAVLAMLLGLPAACGGATRQDGGSASRGEVTTGGQSGGGAIGAAGGAGRDSTGGSDSTAGASGSGGQDAVAGSAGQGGESSDVPGPLIPFMTLLIERGGANGYCITPGQIMSGGIAYGQLGDFQASGSAFRGWVGAPPECYGEDDDPNCYLAESFQVQLSDNQVSELAGLLQELPEDRCEDAMQLCDPCEITTVTVDLETYSNHCCGTQLSPGYEQALQSVLDYLDSLVPAPAPCVGEDLHVTLVDEFGEEYRLDGSSADPGVAAAIRQDVVVVEVFEETDQSLTLRVNTTTGEIGIDWNDNNEWGYEALSTDYGGPYYGATIGRNDGAGGVVEGIFEGVELGYSYEGREMIVSGTFRACVEAP